MYIMKILYTRLAMGEPQMDTLLVGICSLVVKALCLESTLVKCIIFLHPSKCIRIYAIIVSLSLLSN